MPKVPQGKELDKNVGTISAMFDSIAPAYDKLNHRLSFGFDKGWRKKLIKSVLASGAENVLDVACGSGDVSLALHKAGLKVIGVDISEKMLEIARQKSPEDIKYQYGDASRLPFEDESFDCITIAFGIRNFDKLDQCVKEMYRIIKKGGSINIVEFGLPKNALWKWMYTIYFKHILPVIGSRVSGNKEAYTYLPQSSFAFPYGDAFCRILSKGGFENLEYKSMTGGIAFLYTGRKC